MIAMDTTADHDLSINDGVRAAPRFSMHAQLGGAVVAKLGSTTQHNDCELRVLVDRMPGRALLASSAVRAGVLDNGDRVAAQDKSNLVTSLEHRLARLDGQLVSLSLAKEHVLIQLGAARARIEATPATVPCDDAGRRDDPEEAVATLNNDAMVRRLPWLLSAVAHAWVSCA